MCRQVGIRSQREQGRPWIGGDPPAGGLDAVEMLARQKRRNCRNAILPSIVTIANRAGGSPG
jgi:hypothetical protein